MIDLMIDDCRIKLYVIISHEDTCPIFAWKSFFWGLFYDEVFY